MHSFHHSRARIFFEIFCALTISASCAVAWTQTGASALLPVAAIAALYSLVLATDAGRRPKAIAVAAPLPEPIVEEKASPLSLAGQAEEAPAIEELPKAPTRAKRKSRKKEVAPVAAPEPRPVELVVDEPDEEHHAPIAPLFERQPIVAQQRAVFGRKAG